MDSFPREVPKAEGSKIGDRPPNFSQNRGERSFFQPNDKLKAQGFKASSGGFALIFMIIGFLAVLSASVAAGMRIGLPLLVILLLYGDQLTANLPLIGWLPPQVLVSIFTTWALFELFGSKQLLGQRILQVVELIFSPFAGIILSVTAAQVLAVEFRPLWVIGALGGLIAFVFKLVLTGWFFRLRGLPIWWAFVEDILCVALVLFAFRSPQEGGIIAMILLWLAMRSSTEWKRYYDEGRSPQTPLDPPAANLDQELENEGEA